MIYRRFGRTNLQMPVFSCGGMRFQYGWGQPPLSDIPPDNQANLEATIRRALEVGINHIETARGYGPSEAQLGRVLPKLPRERIIVQTKIAPTRDPAEFLKHFDESLARLQLDRVDLFGFHGINTHEGLHWTVRRNGCLAAARKLQKQGKIGHVGFSTHALPVVIDDALKHEDDGGFDFVNLHWFYIFQKNWPSIEEATRRDMGVFIISPSDKGGQLYNPPAKLVELCRPLSPMTFNGLFCLSHPQVHTLSIGAVRPTDFDEHLKVVDLLPRASEVLKPIVARLEQAMVDAVGEDLVKWDEQGLPEWSDAPAYVNLPMILWLHNLVEAYDLVEFAKMRYNLLGSGGDWFPGNHAGAIEGRDISGALADSPAKDRILAIVRKTHERLAAAPEKRLSQSAK